MICNNCGKSNIPEAKICTYCKSPMPQSNSMSGFADILKVPLDANTQNSNPSIPVQKENAEDEKLKKIIENNNKLLKKIKSIAFTSTITVVLSLIITGLSITFGIISYKNMKQLKTTYETKLSQQTTQFTAKLDTLKKDFDELKKELYQLQEFKEYKNQLTDKTTDDQEVTEWTTTETTSDKETDKDTSTKPQTDKKTN